ncbi:MerR family transcriptional regulator [Corynebacterium sp. H113]|uniref:MerR family transcriptional regulator n=1 Tax=Corynebacterium sp. H113 TaxID=3133419 RepID=UPI003099012C
MRISEVASAAGCSVRAVRHYHEAGALPEPKRDSNGYRNYSLSDLAGLLRVRTCVEAGIPLSTIHEPDAMNRALTLIDDRIAELEVQRDRLYALMRDEQNVPSDIVETIGMLIDDPALRKQELDALSLMALTGVATAATWSTLRYNLGNQECLDTSRRLTRLWRELGMISAKDLGVQQMLTEFVELFPQGWMKGVVETLVPGDLPLTTSDVNFVGAQALIPEALAAVLESGNTGVCPE